VLPGAVGISSCWTENLPLRGVAGTGVFLNDFFLKTLLEEVLSVSNEWKRRIV